MKIILLVFILYIMFILMARHVNYLMIKKNIGPRRYVGTWFIPIVNIFFILIETAELMYKWNGKGLPTKLSITIDKFSGKHWEYENTLDPNIEQILNNIDVKDIEKFLRKKKLKGLK